MLSLRESRLEPPPKAPKNKKKKKKKSLQQKTTLESFFLINYFTRKVEVLRTQRRETKPILNSTTAKMKLSRYQIDFIHFLVSMFLHGSSTTDLLLTGPSWLRHHWHSILGCLGRPLDYRCSDPH